MILTQDEARKWSEILKGFAEGKEYQIPMIYNDDGSVKEYARITDFAINEQCPTISMTYPKNVGMINPNLVSEVRE